MSIEGGCNSRRLQQSLGHIDDPIEPTFILNSIQSLAHESPDMKFEYLQYKLLIFLDNHHD